MPYLFLITSKFLATMLTKSESLRGERGGYPCGVIVNAMDCRIVFSEFELQSHHYVHIRTNIFGKGMNHIILRSMG